MLFRRPSGDPAADAEAALAVPHSGARIVSATVVHQSTEVAHPLSSSNISIGSLVSSALPQSLVDALPAIDPNARVAPAGVVAEVIDDSASSDGSVAGTPGPHVVRVRLRAADAKAAEGSRRRLPPGARTYEPLLRPRKNPHGLLRFEDLPAWLRDNFYIITGYRPELSTYTACLRSIFYVHNESGNIWTHLFGAALFVGLAAYTYAGVFPALGAADWRDAGVFAAFFLGAFVCLSMSGFFHTFCAHSAEVSCRWNKIDYVGIVALIVGSFFPPVFYGFYCQPAWQYAYLAGMTILGSLCAIFAVADAFQHPSWRWFRTSLFLALGCCGVVPLIHILVSLGYPAAVSMGMWYMVAMGLMYVAGAMLYGFRWPERQWPGRFDYVGQSHQIFHVLVVAAAAAHWLGTVGSARWRHDPAEGRWACGA